jgi:hypothetical protein
MEALIILFIILVLISIGYYLIAQQEYFMNHEKNNSRKI